MLHRKYTVPDVELAWIVRGHTTWSVFLTAVKPGKHRGYKNAYKFFCFFVFFHKNVPDYLGLPAIFHREEPDPIPWLWALVLKIRSCCKQTIISGTIILTDTQTDQTSSPLRVFNYFIRSSRPFIKKLNNKVDKLQPCFKPHFAVNQSVFQPFTHTQQQMPSYEDDMRLTFNRVYLIYITKTCPYNFLPP